jgi:hypothetical protein
MRKPTVEIGTWGEKERRGPAAPDPALKNLEALSWLLDSSIPIPGMRIRIGVESLLGLIPVLGDALGALLSTYILVVSAKLGAPRVTLLRMGFNVTLEAAVGLIPFLGDLFDFAWKANQRNVDLLRAHLENPSQARRGDWFFAALFILGVIAMLFLFGWAAFSLGQAFRHWLAA